MPKNKKLIIFDWDGTLMDSIDRIVSSIQNAARKAGLAVPSEALASSVIGLSLNKALAIVFPTADEPTINHLIELYREEYIELNPTPTPLFADAKACLQQLREQGYLLAVATGKARAGLSRAMASVGLNDFFDASICADESRSKPDPLMLTLLLKKFNVPVETAIMVGDSVHDLKMAQAAGMMSVAVTMGADSAERLAAYQPIAIVDSLSQLTSVIQQLSLTQAED
ncbi:HAD family hydrolase [Gayadomonas joobiniege]|uniref:HAD family hydrolase n=1 Tax=Gayadomonas joobiniege TaxID=1234606 RepID=UPI0003757E71|nr:HAD-IA family hydrolase [Gayadomonas joobiniege]